VSGLAAKPTVPTRPLVRQKIVGPVHLAVDERNLEANPKCGFQY
jgi:hypothetical protein